ncbi:MAG: hypothetical protein J5892_01005 [Bacilli bacterium]|nr:hypothetical protein [Bacilli bacterium]
MTKEEMLNVKGGISAALISAVIRGVSVILSAGQFAGSAIRRITKKNYC